MRSASARYRSASCSDPAARLSPAASTASSGIRGEHVGGKPGQQLAGGRESGRRGTSSASCPRAAAPRAPSSRPPARGESPRPDARARPTTRRRSCAGPAAPPGRSVAARARAGPRTGGGSETTIAPRPATPRTRPRPRAPPGSAQTPSTRSAGQPAVRSPAPASRSATAAGSRPPAGARAPRPAGTRPLRAHARRSWPRSRSGSGSLAIDSAASRRPAAHPSVVSRPATRAHHRTERTPAASNSARDSPTLKRKSSPRISVSSPSTRNRCSPNRRSRRVSSTNRSCGGARREQQLNLADGVLGLELVQVVDHQPQPLRQRAQILQQPPDDGRAVQTGRGGQLPHPLRPDPRPPQRFEHRQPERLRIVLPRPTDTHAARSPRPSAAIHERTRNVFPLPAGADTKRHPLRPAQPLKQARAAEPTTASHQKPADSTASSRVGHDAHGCTPASAQPPSIHPNDAMRAHPPARRL